MTGDTTSRPPGQPLPPRVADLAGHAFLRGMPEASIATLALTCRVAVAEAGHRYFDEGAMATKFWLVKSGHVALDLHVPGRSRLILETLGPGELLGLSWFTPPFRWQYGAVAVQKTSSFELDGAAVRAACDADPALGYELLRRLMSAASGRLHAARIRMLDLYGAPDTPGENS